MVRISTYLILITDANVLESNSNMLGQLSLLSKYGDVLVP